MIESPALRCITRIPLDCIIILLISICQYMPELLSSKSKITAKKQSDRLLDNMIKKNPAQMRRLVLKLAKKNNPRLLSQIRVEDLFKKHIEFDSRSQLLRALKGSMKADTLNTIIARFVQQDKLVINEDHSLTWIDTRGNDKLNQMFDEVRMFHNRALT